MNEKQFDLFQTGIQWVADEARFHRTQRVNNWVRGARRWLQRTWAQGVLLGNVHSVRDPQTGRMIDVQAVCPTACCVAGNFCAINGDTFVSAAGTLFPRQGETYVEGLQWVMDEDENMHLIGQRGRALTGMTENEANMLFHQNNNSATVIRLAKGIAEAHGHTLNIIE